ncbi:MAG: hypothetical protein ACJ786_18110 [Catenulispora sp.]
MSTDELAKEYSEGRISRRIFIRSLMATGVTAGAAVAYAQFLSPSAYGRTSGGSGSGTTGGKGGGQSGIYGSTTGGGGSGSGTSAGSGGGKAGRPGGAPGS